MHKLLVGLGVVLFLVLAIAVFVAQTRSDENAIGEWGKQQGYQVTSIDRTAIDNGPFWFRDDDDRIYRVELLDDREAKRVIYFRFRLFSTDKEWYH